MNILGIDHTSYTVASLERSLTFYVGLLGFDVVWQREIADQYFRDIVGFPDCVVKAAHLRVPNSTHKLELFEYVTPCGTAADVRTNNAGSSHIALYVDDVAAAYAELRARGVRFRSAPITVDTGANKGASAVYLLDPDGITVELLQRAV